MKLFQSHREHHISWYDHIAIQDKDKGAMTRRNDTDAVRALIFKLITVEVCRLNLKRNYYWLNWYESQLAEV